MQKIFPSPQKTAFLRNGKLEVLPSISELGIFGTFVGYGTSFLSQSVSPILNNYGGYLLRTKPLGVDEGGVATGYSVLNSIVFE